MVWCIGLRGGLSSFINSSALSVISTPDLNTVAFSFRRKSPHNATVGFVTVMHLGVNNVFLLFDFFKIGCLGVFFDGKLDF